MKAAVSPALVLQMLFYFDFWFCLLWLAFTIVSTIYKGKSSETDACISHAVCTTAVALPYPSSPLGYETALMSAVFIIDVCRILLGWKANKTLQIAPLVLAFIACGPLIAAHVYFLERQTYVLRVDQIFNVISIIFLGAEALLTLPTIITFARR